MTQELTLETLYLKIPLYKTVKVSESEIDELDEFLSDHASSQFDCYCVECKKEVTFRSPAKYVDPYSRRQPFIQDKMNETVCLPFEKIYSCQRNPQHIYSFSFRCINNTITKIGQYPSIASLELHTIQKYRIVLSNDYQDFSKAIGLFAHGVGAGSFVYLRRIFENLIEEKHIEAQQDADWSEEAYKQARMDNKIDLLKERLPEFLVENKKLYGILSKGIHELDEEDCLALFPNVKLAIELILDEKIHLQEKQQKTKSASSLLTKAYEKLVTAKS